MALEETTVDYCIVGAGPAGCVLAARLSEDPKSRVMLLEAGARDRHPFFHIPAAFIFIYSNQRYNWWYETEAEPTLKDRKLKITQGKVLGGSSTINGMLHVRAQEEEFEQWSQSGCTGWTWENMLPYYRKAETYHGTSADREGLRGHDGPHGVSDAADVHQLTRAFVAGARETGMPVMDDMNGPKREGAAFFQHNRKGRFRAQPAQTYLRPAMKRQNLRVEVEAFATRILFEGTRAVGVAYRQGGKDRVVRVRREVILSAGVFKTPQLLQLSGIGDPAHLQSIGVTPLVSRPAVGQNLRDHFLMTVVQRVKGIATLNERARGWRLGKELLKYVFLADGALTLGTGSAGAFFRSRPGLAAPDAQLMFIPGSYGPVPGILEHEPGASIGFWPSHPQSQGSVLASNADPLSQPAIRTNFLTAEDDQRVVVECVRRARAIFASTAMARWNVGEVRPGPDVRTDDEIVDFARGNGRSGMHLAGTCRMGGDEAAPLDPQLRVRGTSGLRVVDASILPNITAGNPNATIVAMAERAVDLIKAAG